MTADPPARLEELATPAAGSGAGPRPDEPALIEAASEPADWVMSAIVGAAGAPRSGCAPPATAGAGARQQGEPACAGALLKRVCAAHGTRLIPVDSEHSAIFQALAAGATRWTAHPDDRLGRTVPRLDHAPDGDGHPGPCAGASNWDMGRSGSRSDSATMFNKALELIEAQMPFDVAPDRVEVARPIPNPSSIRWSRGFGTAR